MLNQNDVMVAQQRYEQMRRESAQESRSRELMGGAHPSLMQRVALMVAGVMRQVAQREPKAKPMGTAVPGKVA